MFLTSNLSTTNKKTKKRKNTSIPDIDSISLADAILEEEKRKNKKQLKSKEQDSSEDDDDYTDSDSDNGDDIHDAENLLFKRKIINIIVDTLEKSDSIELKRKFIIIIEKIWRIIIQENKYYNLKNIIDNECKTYIQELYLTDWIDYKEDENNKMSNGKISKIIYSIIMNWTKHNIIPLSVEYILLNNVIDNEKENTINFIKSTIINLFPKDKQLPLIIPKFLDIATNIIENKSKKISKAIFKVSRAIHNGNEYITQKNITNNQFYNHILTMLHDNLTLKFDNILAENVKRQFILIDINSLFNELNINDEMMHFDWENNVKNSTNIIKQSKTAYKLATKMYEKWLNISKKTAHNGRKEHAGKKFINYLEEKLKISVKTKSTSRNVQEEYYTNNNNDHDEYEEEEYNSSRINSINDFNNIKTVDKQLIDVISLAFITIINSQMDSETFINTCYTISKTLIKSILPDIDGFNSISYTLLSKTYWVNNKDYFLSLYNKLFEQSVFQKSEYLINNLSKKWSKHIIKWIIANAELVIKNISFDEIIDKIKLLKQHY